ncbi:MAG: hypothetical protein ACFFDW_01540 [Candidatus Thorarchaeota archaeon]
MGSITNNLSIEVPNFTYNSTNGHLTIPEFNVNFINETGTYVLTEEKVTIAEYHVVVDPMVENTIIEEGENLQFNGSTNRWFYDSHLVMNTQPLTNHTILYKFKMNGSLETWSNYSAMIFAVDHFEAEFSNFDVEYNPTTFTVSITNVTCYLPDISEINFVDDTEIVYARWYLYTTGQGVQSTDYSIPAFDTEGNPKYGPLYFDNDTKTWYSNNNDIGLVYTQPLQLYLIKVRFEILGIPVGYIKSTIYGDEFYAYLQKNNGYFFQTRDHIITHSVPEISFEENSNFLNFHNITARSDYNNTFLDDYEIIQKPIYGQERRQAIWLIFYPNNIATTVGGHLSWSEENQWWYKENVDIKFLANGLYYIKAKISNMNVNITEQLWSAPSDTFMIIDGKLVTDANTKMVSNFGGIFYMTICFVISIIACNVYLANKRNLKN